MASRGLHVALWVAQVLLALTFVGGGVWKVLTPIPELAKAMPWTGQGSRAFAHALLGEDWFTIMAH